MAKKIIFTILVDNKDQKKKTKETKADFIDLSKVAEGAFGAMRDAALKKLKPALQKIGETLTSVTKIGIALFKTVAKASAGFVIDAVKNFAQYEDVLGHARRTMSLTREETLKMGTALMDLASNMEEGGLKAGITANGLGKIAGILGQLGFSIKENDAAFLQMVQTVAKVGIAFGMSNQKAAEGLGILRNLYNLPIENIERVASSIAALGNSTVATASQIMDIMTRMGGIAGLLGVSAQESVGISSTLREAGISTQVAGTAMSQIFSRLSSDVDKFGEVLKSGGVSSEMLRMNIESGKATEALKSVLQGIQNINRTEGKIAAIQALKDLGLSGVRVQQALLGLSNNIGDLNANIALSEQAFRENVAVNEAYQAAIDNSSRYMQQFWNILDNIKKIIGVDLSQAFSDFLELHLNPFISSIEEWLKTSEAAEGIFGANGIIANGFKVLGELLDANKERFFDFLNTLDVKIPEAINYVKENWKSWAETTGVFFEETFEDLKSLVTFIKDVGKWIDNVQRKWEDFANTMSFFTEQMSNLGFMQDFFDAVLPVNKTSEAVEELTRNIKKTTEATKDFAEEAYVNSAFPDTTKAVNVTNKAIRSTITELNGATGALSGVYKTGANTWSNLKREVQDYQEEWKLNNDRTLLDMDNVQFKLTQTAENVTSLGAAYAGMGQMAEEAGMKAQNTAHRVETFYSNIWRNAVQLQNVAASVVSAATSGNDAVLQQLAGAGGGLNMHPGERFGALTGNIGSAKNDIDQILKDRMNATPALPASPSASGDVNVTVKVDEQELFTLSSALTDQDQQTRRRGSLGI